MLVALGAAAAMDQKAMRIPNVLLVIAAIFGAVAADAANVHVASLAGAGVAAAPLLLIHVLDPSALGFGDVKFAGTSGLVVGAIAWPVAVLVPLVALVSVTLARIAGSRKRRPFGPFLMISTSMALIAAAAFSAVGALA